MTGSRRSTVAVVGGGISGLTAAYRLRQQLGEHVEIVIYEPSDQLGGVLRTVALDGHRVDVGAEAFIVRRPEVVELLAELGLADKQITPTGVRPLLYAAGRLSPLPTRTVSGIPASGASVAAVVDEETVARIDSDSQRPMSWVPGSDSTVADLVSARFGPQVVARLVDPLLGGVYAGTAATTGLRAAAPTIARALDEGAGSLLMAARMALPPISEEAVFGAVDGGYAVLIAALEQRIHARRERVEVAKILGHGDRWQLRTGTGDHGADAVVVAVPAPRAAKVLAGVAPDSARALTAIDVASSVVVAFSLPADVPIPANSGVLVASGESLHSKAITFSTTKWGLRDGSTQVVRLSFGRFGDTVARACTDEQLIDWATEDLAVVLGQPITPRATTIARWIDAMPQYRSGHAQVVQRIRDGLPPGVAVAGSYLDGIGVPACVAAATTAAQTIVARWGHA